MACPETGKVTGGVPGTNVVPVIASVIMVATVSACIALANPIAHSSFEDIDFCRFSIVETNAELPGAGFIETDVPFTVATTAPPNTVPLYTELVVPDLIDALTESHIPLARKVSTCDLETLLLF